MPEFCQLCMWLAGLHGAPRTRRKKLPPAPDASIDLFHVNVAASRPTTTVEVVAVQTCKLVTVSWRDATAGRYGNQTWIRGRAKQVGVCGISGLHIDKRDVVFHPRILGTDVPFNAAAMILASEVDWESIPEKEEDYYGNRAD